MTCLHTVQAKRRSRQPASSSDAADELHLFAGLQQEVRLLGEDSARDTLEVEATAVDDRPAQDPRVRLALQCLEAAVVVRGRVEDVDEPLRELLAELSRDRTVQDDTIPKAESGSPA